MRYLGRLALCALFSVIAHVVIARGMSRLPAQEQARPKIVGIALVPPPPPPEPPPPPPLEPQVARAVPKPRDRATPARSRKPSDEHPGAPPPATPSPPTERPAASGPTTDVPRFGISMESTSAAGRGPAMRTGNTTETGDQGPRATGPSRPMSGGAVAGAHEVTKMPIPRGRCTGKYTDAARAAAIEGTVVLDLVVGEDGRPRSVIVVEGLGHGLSEAAVAALKACRFSPGERDGKPVAVRLPRFKITFVLQDGR